MPAIEESTFKKAKAARAVVIEDLEQHVVHKVSDIVKDAENGVKNVLG